MLRNLITLTVFLIVVSSIGLVFFPSQMLAFVGIVSNPQMDFLLRTAGAGIVCLAPGLWAARNSPASPVSRAVFTGAAGYLFLSSIVDLPAYLQGIVNAAAIPSIVFRVLLGAAILFFMRKETAKA